MKVRSGFVSNSSSASFVIGPNKKFKTVYDVAKAMMLDLRQDSGYDYEKELKVLEKYKSEPDTPVYFPTSDGTYIRKVKDRIIVSSTHHYNPDIFSSYFLSFNEIGDDVLKSLEYEDDDNDYEDRHRKIDSFEDFDWYWKQFDDFILLNYDVVGVLSYLKDNRYGKPCPHCGESGYAEGIRRGNHIYCTCQVEKLKRKLKLEKIKTKEHEKGK